MYMKLRFFLVCYIQEGGQKQNLLEQSCSTRSESFLVGATKTESFLVDATNTESFGSGKPGPSFGNSKGFFLFSATEASSTIDFSRAPVDEGVVESPPSNDVGQTIVCSPFPLRSSNTNGVCRFRSERYTGSAHPRQLYGPSHVGSPLEMTNVGESSPCFEVQNHATCRTKSPMKHMSEEQLLEKMGTTSEPNQSSPRILWRKEFSEATTSIPMRRGSSTSDSHFKLVQQMKYASAHPFLRLGKYCLRDQGRPTNRYSRREEIMRNVEKMRALDLESVRH
jgi:hypothetical protein